MCVLATARTTRRIIQLSIHGRMRPTQAKKTHVDDPGEDEPEVGLGQHALLEALVLPRREEEPAKHEAHSEGEAHEHQGPVLCD